MEGVGWRPNTKGLGFGCGSRDDFYRGTGFFCTFFYIIAAWLVWRVAESPLLEDPNAALLSDFFVTMGDASKDILGFGPGPLTITSLMLF